MPRRGMAVMKEDIDMSALNRFGNLIILIAVLLLLPQPATAEQTTSREYPTLYKSTRAMGMGGAYVAVGGRVDTLFYNPAGLINLPRDKGWEVDLLNVSGETSKNTKAFLTDLKDADKATDTNGSGSADDEKLQAVNNVLAKYRGENLHARVADLTAMGKGFDRWAFGVGMIGSGRLDAMTHQGLGADGILEVNADATYGVLGGVSIKVNDDLAAGVGVKYLHRESLVHEFTSRELVEHQNDLNAYIRDDLRQKGTAIGTDAGVIWKFAKNTRWRPSVGASVLNIGGLHFGNAGSIPQTLNAGVSVNPVVPFFRSLIVGIDYIDISNNYKKQYDQDMTKRLRYGAELQIIDILPFEAAVRAGMYEGAATVGCDLRLAIFTLSYALYSEEIGGYAGQDRDKRQLLTLNIGW